MFLLLPVVARLAVAEPASAGDQAALAAIHESFEERRRLSVRVWSARSNLAVSDDGSGLFFVEHGADGLVLKKVDLLSGRVTRLGPVNGDYYRVAAIPNDPGHLLVAEEAMGSRRAQRVAVFDVDAGTERLLDVGDNASGDLEVSPSGKYVLTGVDYYCHTGDRDCFAENLAVVSLATGRQEHKYRVPVVEEKTREYPVAVDVNWLEGDMLSFTPRVGDASKGTTLQRGPDGRWEKTSVAPSAVPRAMSQSLAPGTRSLSFSRPKGRTSISIDPTVLFRPGPGRISAHSLSDRVLVLREPPPDKDGWELIEVVELKWRDAANTK
jgi:hypothetical protein